MTALPEVKVAPVSNTVRQEASELTASVTPTEGSKSTQRAKITARSTDLNVNTQTAARVPPKTRPTAKPIAKPKPKIEPAAKKISTNTAQKKAAPTPAKAGNASVNTRKGQTSGEAAGKVAEASKQTGNTKVKNVGNGAVRTYQSSVMRKISRVPQRSSVGQGEAVASVRITRSSGNVHVDKAALAHVIRAGPFSAPRHGQPIRFSGGVKIKS